MKTTKSEVLKELFFYVKAASVAFVIVFFMHTVVIVHATVPSASMENTIPTGTRIVGSRLSYIFSEPSRFDVIAFDSPDGTSTRYIKRVIGLGGETVDIVNGEVFIDGDALPLYEWYLLEPPAHFSLITQSFEIPEGHFFVMGDHRNNSRDSRGLGGNPWENLFIPKENIIGRAIFMYFPNIGIIR